MSSADIERFRLRRFIERLVQLGECEVHDKPIDLIDVASVLDGNARATWFKAVGPERAELIGNVMGSRKRLALALDTDEAGLTPESEFDTTWAYEYRDAETLGRAMIAVAGLAVLAGPDREHELETAIVEGLAPFRRPDGSYRFSNEYRFLIASA